MENALSSFVVVLGESYKLPVVLVGLVACSCFLCRNDSEFRRISKSELRWGRRALWALFLGELVQLLKADRCTPF